MFLGIMVPKNEEILKRVRKGVRVIFLWVVQLTSRAVILRPRGRPKKSL